MEPETLEARISECPGGARAGPEPEPGARGWPLSRRGRGPRAPSSRPAPDPGGAAPQSAARTLAAAQPGCERVPPTHPVTLKALTAAPKSLPLEGYPPDQGLSLHSARSSSQICLFPGPGRGGLLAN